MMIRMKIEESVSHSCSKEFIVLGDGISDESSSPQEVRLLSLS